MFESKLNDVQISDVFAKWKSDHFLFCRSLVEAHMESDYDPLFMHGRYRIVFRFAGDYKFCQVNAELPYMTHDSFYDWLNWAYQKAFDEFASFLNKNKDRNYMKVNYVDHRLTINEKEVIGQVEMNKWFNIKKVIFAEPATIVYWNDGSKTVVKCENEDYDPEKGLAMAISKRALGNTGRYYNTFKEHCHFDDVNMPNAVEVFFDDKNKNA